MPHNFTQVDVFSTTPCGGNPVAVVHDADGMSTAEMQRFANWTNLSETTFLVEPTTPAADYRVRIFSPSTEFKFAGHPTLGTCHAWLAARGIAPTGTDGRPATVVQECGAGLVTVRRSGSGLAFAAPPLLRSGQVTAELLERAACALRIEPSEIIEAVVADNGTSWVAVLLRDAEAVMAIDPGKLEFKIGVVGAHPAGCDAAIEVRAFFPKNGSTAEDPVTGSLNAGIAPWLIGTGRVSAPYVAAQGTKLGRVGRVNVTAEADGTIWVGGATTTIVTGTVDLPSGPAIESGT